MGKRWIPLESNPDVLNHYVQKLGWDVGKFAFCDVLGLDEELLAMVPSPVLAVVMLFPLTDQSEALRHAENDKLDAARLQGGPVSLFYMTQTIGNACGTIGVLHALGNNRADSVVEAGSFLQRFFDATKDMSPAERGAYLEHPPADAPDLDDAHQAAAQEGATLPPSADESIMLHFVTLVQHDGRLWELDGRKAAPVDHGPTSRAMLLRDAARVIGEFVATTASLNFTALALAPPEDA